MREYYVYIMASKSKTLYVGVTNDLLRRVYEHKHKLVKGFTSRYNVTNLVYFETTGEVQAAIAREKEIKGWVRRKKTALIRSVNPMWDDLSAEWYGIAASPAPATGEDGVTLRSDSTETQGHNNPRK